MTDKITIERAALERWTETLNQHVHHGKSEWWIALNEMRAALAAQPADARPPLPELRDWLRENLVIEAALVDPHRDDVRISLRFKDEDDPFTWADVLMPEKW